MTRLEVVWLMTAIAVTTLLFVLGDIGAPEFGLVVMLWAGLIMVVLAAPPPQAQRT